MENEKRKIQEKIRQLNILVENCCNKKKFGDKTEEFKSDFRQFKANIVFFVRDSYIGAVSEIGVKKDTISHLIEAIKNLKSMKEIAEEYKQNSLATYVNEIIDYLEKVKQRLILLVK